MKFGAVVLVSRGGSKRRGPGRSRKVRGVLVGARGVEVFVRLLDDDPDSTIGEWSHAGDVGRWSRSQIGKVTP